MKFVRIQSRSGIHMNAEVRCEHCKAARIVYGYNTEAWYSNVKYLKCQECGKVTNDKLTVPTKPD